MSCQSVRSWLETAQHYISRAVHWFTRCIGHLRRQHQVHPTSLRSISALTHSKIVKLGSKRRIRVIHIEPSKQRADQDVRGQLRVKGSLENKLNIVENKHLSAKNVAFSADSNDSDSEGYWFTRWNRPLKFSEACHCSFRNSAQGSRTVSQVFGINKLPIEETVTNEKHCRKQYDFSETTLLHINENVQAIVSDIIEEMLDKVLLTVFHDQQNKASTSSFEDYFGCKNEAEEISERLQQNSNCETKIICQKLTSGFRVQEVAFGDQQECILEIPSNVVTYSSSGCINPSFLGTNIDPDTFGYVISCENPFVKTEHSDRDANSLEFEEMKCFDDSDSGFNTASLESTNNHSQKDEGVCCTSKRQNVHTVTDPTFDIKMGKKLEICNAIGPETASISDSKLWSPTSLDPNGVMIDTKDNLEISNQMTITSLDVNAAPPYRAEHSSPPVSRHSTNDRVQDQEDFSKQCYHTRHFARLKPVLLFLHGVGCSADLWTTLLSHFSNAGYEVLAPDMLGHGYSSAPDSPGAYIFHRLLKDVIDIFDKFVGDNRMCVVIGHAYGSSLASALARYRAQQVSHLVLISGGGPTPLAPRTADSRPPSMSPYLQAFLKPLIFCGFRRNIIYGPCGKHIETSSVMSKGIPNYVLHHVAQGQDWSEGDSTFHRRILVPTLLVHGMQDPYVTLVQECEMERTIPRSFLELIPDAGHFAMLETPEELTQMIHCFIEWWRR